MTRTDDLTLTEIADHADRLFRRRSKRAVKSLSAPEREALLRLATTVTDIIDTSKEPPAR